MDAGSYRKVQFPSGVIPFPVRVLGSKAISIENAPSNADQRLELACREFESIFIQYMIKVMMESSQNGYLGGEGRGKEIYQFLMEQELAKKIAGQGGMGIANKLYSLLKKSQRWR